ncbi:hypothetical protein RIF29_14243 [Crotalaria pallida]|uniref:Uncharacterized protein n=1 Tax=Crotalaria pallida TaxID=3830 RepID=A0AAN9FBD2_CROPI
MLPKLSPLGASQPFLLLPAPSFTNTSIPKLSESELILWAYFASLKGQYEIVVHHYIQVLRFHQEEAKKALEVLQKSSVPLDLQYKFAPDLIALDAYETVESWMATDNLNPRKLIPAMMCYSSEPDAKNETHEVIKYLEYCVHRLKK